MSLRCSFFQQLATLLDRLWGKGSKEEMLPFDACKDICPKNLLVISCIFVTSEDETRKKLELGEMHG